jgi:hypothetical protein
MKSNNLRKIQFFVSYIILISIGLTLMLLLFKLSMWVFG